jgi:hypothetical protein
MRSNNARELTGRHIFSVIPFNSGSAGIVLCITTASVFLYQLELPLFVPAHAGSSKLSASVDQALFGHLRRKEWQLK